MSRASWVIACAIGVHGCSAETLDLSSGLDVPELVDFGDTGEGLETERIVELFNGSSERITILELATDEAFEGPLYGFSFHEPPAGIDPKSSALLRVVFFPRDETSRVSSTVSVKTSAGTASMTLRARGVRAMQLEPVSLDFGQVRRGSTAERELVIHNLLDVPLPVVLPDTGPPSPGGGVFHPLTDHGGPIPPREQRVVHVRYTPDATAEGPAMDRTRWRFTYCADRNICGASIDLVGQRTDPRPGCLEAVPASIDFGEVFVGGLATASIRVRNICDHDVVLAVVTINSSVFSARNGPAVIAGGGAYALTIDFAPTGGEAFSAVLSIQSDDSASPILPVPLFGTGVFEGSCELNLASPPLMFGATEIMRTETAAIVLENIGSVPCLVGPVRFTGFNTENFQLRSRTSTIWPGESGLIEISYTPDDYSGHRAAYHFDYSSGNGRPSMASGELAGSGADNTPVIYPDRLDVGAIPAGCSRASSVRIFNPRSTPISIEAIELAAGSSPDFTVASPPLPLAIDAFAAVDIPITYTPSFGKIDSAALQIRGRGHLEPYTVWLLGREGDRNEERFLQPMRPAIDVVFMIDGTSSMADERDALAMNLQTFIDFGNISGADFQVSTTTVGDAKLLGALHELRAPSLFRENAGFVRRDATLAIVFVTDADDASPGEVSEYAADFWRIHGARDKNALSFHVISGGANGCVGSGTQADAAPRLTDVSLLTPGAYSSICSGWPVVLDELGRAILGARSIFALQNRPVPPGLVEVFVDGVSIPRFDASGQTSWAMATETNILGFNPQAVPPPGSELVRLVREQLQLRSRRLRSRKMPALGSRRV